MSTAPRVMVSSTFFDLRQIRADLARFITEELGYLPLLSELPSFPVDPDLNTIENCRARVEKNADILILVIGGRYGSIDSKTDKSITNLEFLAARGKGIPIYVFVEKAILAILPVWKTNPSADFSATVDTPKLFEFVEKVRTEDRVWSFPFESAQDVISTLRIQLGYLFNESLQVRQRLSGTGWPSFLDLLEPKSLRIVLERPPGWEYRLFLQCWIDATESRNYLVREYRAGLALDMAESVPAQSGSEWLSTRLHEVEGFVASANQLLNESAKEAFGPEGQPGDAESIIWVAQMIGSMFEKFLLWVRRIRCAHVEAPYDKVAPELALITDDLIAQLQRFPRDALSAVEEALASSDPVRREVKMTLELKMSNAERLHQAMESVRLHYRL